MLKRKQFLLGITTTDEQGNGWRKKIKEIDELGLKKVAFFPTCLEKAQRKEFYGLLEKTGLKEIPFVHIRGDMDYNELDYLIKRYKTKAFNIHTGRQHPAIYDYSKYKKMLYLENTFPFDETELKGFAGICLDLSHLEDDKNLRKDIFKHRQEMIEKYKVGCNHISAISQESQKSESGKDIYSGHYFRELSEFDYLKNYPKTYFSKFIGMELENSLKEQLQAIEYILNL